MTWDNVLKWALLELAAASGLSGVKIRRAFGELPSATGVYVELPVQRRGQQWADVVELRLHVYSTQGEEHCSQLLGAAHAALLAYAGQPKTWNAPPEDSGVRIRSVVLGDASLPERDGEHTSGYAAMLPVTVRASLV